MGVNSDVELFVSFFLFLKMNDRIKNILLSISSARLSCVWFYVKCWQIFLVSSMRHLYKKTHTQLDGLVRVI